MRATLAAVLCLMFVAAAGCGSSTNDADNFVGVWQPNTGGAVTLTCNTGTFVLPVDSPTTFAKGTISDLASTSDSCSVLFDVEPSSSGHVANAQPGQQCTQTDATSTVHLNVGTWTFTTNDGIAGTESSNGTATITRLADGAMATCSFTEVASYRRISH